MQKQPEWSIPFRLFFAQALFYLHPPTFYLHPPTFTLHPSPFTLSPFTLHPSHYQSDRERSDDHSGEIGGEGGGNGAAGLFDAHAAEVDRYRESSEMGDQRLQVRKKIGEKILFHRYLCHTNYVYNNEGAKKSIRR